ncbi:MAG TPA: hypothetical protein VME92_00660, partial [Acetobacteraceae bacterium]|nr:hypothetical protein [Acetobacteraceae bacterium]
TMPAQLQQIVPVPPPAFAPRMAKPGRQGPRVNAERSPATLAPAPERRLAEAVERACRAPRDRMMLVLHLSRMPPPAPRPHHRRIARALLHEAAQRHDGDVFPLRNGDLVLLCRGVAGPLGAGGAVGTDLPQLPATLARLFRVDAPDPSQLISVWALDQARESIVAYLDARITDAPEPVPVAPEPNLAPTALAELEAVIRSTGIADLMQRQTAVLVTAGAQGRLQPLFREVTFSLALLQARLAAAGLGRGIAWRDALTADPFLFRHLAGRLDAHMLDRMRQEVHAGPQPPADGPALHLNLTLPAALSAAFESFAAACRAADVRAGVEVQLLDACADPDSYARLRQRSGAAGVTLVLDGVTHLALQLTDPSRLDADLVKLEWTPALADRPGAERAAIAAALTAIGPDRIVLQRAETERALDWGLAQGIRRFQGRHVDAILGAARIVACPHARACTLRQCVERAAAISPAGRRFCLNHALLDAGAPLFGSPAPARVAR